MAPLAMASRSIKKKEEAAAFAVCERLARFSTADISIELAEFDGNFDIAPTSHLLQRILVAGVYEPELAALASSMVRPGSDVIDVGANIGFFAVLLGKKLEPGRHLLAIEPTEGAGSRLRRNIARNGLSERVIVFSGLAGRDEGQSEMNVFKGQEEYSTVGAVAHPAVQGLKPEIVSMPRRTIDSLVDEHALSPSLIKIDVEGFEMDVLIGAEQTLRQHKPAVLSELSDPLLKKCGSSSQQIIDYLRALDYEVTDALYPGASPGNRDYADILAIHRSRK